MSDETQAKLEKRKAELVKEYAGLQGTVETLLEQGKQIQRQLSEARTRQVALSGAVTEVRDLLGEDITKPLQVGADAKAVPIEASEKKPAAKSKK